MPYYIQYIKFDRLRFLIQGKRLHQGPIPDDLRQQFPRVNFRPLFGVQHSTSTLQQRLTPDQTKRSGCGDEPNDLKNPSINDPYRTEDKRINTDEQYPSILPREGSPQLVDDELQTQGSKQWCSNLQWNDVAHVLGDSFNAPLNNEPMDLTVAEHLVCRPSNSTSSSLGIRRHSFDRSQDGHH